MPALNFVAADDGLEDDPKLLALARMMKVPRLLAFGSVLRWQRLILQRGDHLQGSLPQRYFAADIAAFLDFRRDPERLVEAMEKCGFLGHRKGHGYYFPDWIHTTTGRYAHRRETERLQQERLRAKNRPSRTERPANGVQQSADVDRRSADSLPTSVRQTGERKEARNQETISEIPPYPPPPGGDFADARWRWVEEHAPRPRNRTVCMRILATIPDGEWEQVQAAYQTLQQPGANLSKRDRRALEGPTDLFLGRQVYLQFGRKKQPVKTPRARVTSARTVSAAEGAAERAAAGDAFVVQYLADPDVSEEKKAQARERWLASPENTNRHPPWNVHRARGEHDDDAPPTGGETA